MIRSDFPKNPASLLHHNLLRQKDVFSIREVEYTILETDGQLSVLKKSKFDTSTMSDLKLTPKPTGMPTTIIIDGEILKDNLSTINKMVT